MKITASLVALAAFLFAENLPFPMINPATGKWERVQDPNNPAAPQRLFNKDEDKRRGLPERFDVNAPVSNSPFALISVNISGGAMRFYGKNKSYRPTSAQLRLGTSGSIDVYSADAKDADQPPFPLYYSYQMVNGSPVLFLDPTAREPISIVVNNSMLDRSRTIFASATGANCDMCPSGVSVSVRVIGGY